MDIFFPVSGSVVSGILYITIMAGQAAAMSVFLRQ